MIRHKLTVFTSTFKFNTKIKFNQRFFHSSYLQFNNFQLSNKVLTINNQTYKLDDITNITSTILSKLSKQLHNQPNHPLNNLKLYIHSLLPDFNHQSNFSPIVSVEQNFDRLNVSLDHPGRKPSDSFYINQDIMLRTHTTTNELDVYAMPGDKFSIAADVYRRDEIDATHYPAFHQMELVALFDKESILQKKHSTTEIDHDSVIIEDPTKNLKNLSKTNNIQLDHQIEEVSFLADDMKRTINYLLVKLFSNESQKLSQLDGIRKDPLKIRWIEATFPFTAPSWEVEIFYEGQWLEVLGCGVLRQNILDSNARQHQRGWACGFGLERLAMVLHNISDIRLFWSEDPRFLEQFSNFELKAPTFTKFKPFSKHPPCIKDIAFWIPDGFEQNDLADVVREVAGDIAESVKLVDEFHHPVTKRTSQCYRIIYRSMDRNVTNHEINQIQNELRKAVEQRLNVELR